MRTRISARVTILVLIAVGLGSSCTKTAPNSTEAISAKGTITNQFGEITWTTGSVPLEIICEIQSGDKTNIPVNVVNHSGGNPGQTDERGVARINVGELEVLELWVGGKLLIDHKTMKGAENISAAKGLKFTVYLRDKPIPPR